MWLAVFWLRLWRIWLRCLHIHFSLSLSRSLSHSLPGLNEATLARSHQATDTLPSNAVITGLSPPVCQLLLSNRSRERGGYGDGGTNWSHPAFDLLSASAKHYLHFLWKGTFAPSPKDRIVFENEDARWRSLKSKRRTLESESASNHLYLLRSITLRGDAHHWRWQRTKWSRFSFSRALFFSVPGGPSQGKMPENLPHGPPAVCRAAPDSSW